MRSLADEGMTEGLSAAELAERAGASQEELERMVVLGMLVSRRSQAPFLPRHCSRNRCLARWTVWIPPSGPRRPEQVERSRRKTWSGA